LQPGGHRFDPGQLHQKSAEGGLEYLIDRILGLGGLLVPIVALVVGGVIGVLKLVHQHQERLAKIERGINPDGPWPQQRQ
jgi:hypothetical protein